MAQPIDISAGLVPKKGAIDLSAGLVPENPAAEAAKVQNAISAGNILRNQQSGVVMPPVEQSPLDYAKALGGEVVGAAKGLAHTVGSAAASGANPFTGGLSLNFDPKMLKPNGLAENFGHTIEQGAEFAIPGAGEEKAAVLAGKYVPKLAPFIGNAAKYAPTAAKYGAAALGTGGLNAVQNPDDPNAFAIGAGAGIGGRVLGDTAKAIAPKLAEIALGIRERASKFGATPGEAVLSQTSGIRPGNIAKQVNTRLDSLNTDLTQAANAPTTAGIDLGPARDVVDSALVSAAKENTPSVYKNLGKINGQLNTDMLTGQVIPQVVQPSEALNLRRGLDEEVKTWHPNDANTVQGTIKQARHSISDAFHSAAPETAPIDQQISSLIPAQKAAENKEFSAGIFERAAGRLAKHTGAAVLGGIGANKGYERGGIPGAIAGGALGVIAPEVLTSPEVGMALARSANVVGSPAAKPGIDLTKGYLLQLLKQGRLY